MALFGTRPVPIRYAAAASASLWALALPLVAQQSAAVSQPRDQAPKPPNAVESDQAEVELPALRLREGTRLRDAAGKFRQNGDTLTFIDGQHREITGLPNLNLERVSRMLRAVEEPESINWSVSGTITEFGGRNFVLISRAVCKSATPPPAPEILGEAQILATPAPGEVAPAPGAPAGSEDSAAVDRGAATPESH